MKKPIRILHVVSELNQGGMENFIMNIYRNIDRNKIQFDFIVHHKAIGIFEPEIERLGGKIYHFSIMDDKNIIKYIMEINNFFKIHKEYNVVHGHLGSTGYLYLGAAKKHGVKCCIAHSHTTSTPKSLKGFIKNICFKFYKINSDVRFACSTEAGKFIFNNRNFTIIPNGVDFQRFKYNAKSRNEFRKKYNIENYTLIGHVGRFTVEKNHTFIIKLFKEILDSSDNYRLVLVGDGKLKKEIELLAKNMGLKDKIIFTGNVKDVERIYSAIDIFILPSLFEGLPVSAVESQVSGLPTILSNKITREVEISELVTYLDIEDVELWKKCILSYNGIKNRESFNIKNKDFDIKSVVKYLTDFYFKYY